MMKADEVIYSSAQKSLLFFGLLKMCHKIKRPAHLSIVERLGGFWCCKHKALFLFAQIYL
jgi:hypothetical protein